MNAIEKVAAISHPLVMTLTTEIRAAFSRCAKEAS
jgi:hypothetical protein